MGTEGDGWETVYPKIADCGSVYSGPNVLDGDPIVATTMTKEHNAQRSESVAEEASRLVNGVRDETYGHPRDNFKRIAALWTIWLRETGKMVGELDARDVAMLNLLQKVAREIQEPKRDNRVDIVGYLLALERAESE